MSRSPVRDAPEELLARLVALITGKDVMGRKAEKATKEIRRVVPRRRAPVRLDRSVYEANLAHLRAGTCCCGCGKPSASNARGRAPECYELFRGDRLVKEREYGKEAAQDFDELMQREGRIFPPYFIDKPFEDYDIGAAWEAKRRKVGLAG